MSAHINPDAVGTRGCPCDICPDEKQCQRECSWFKNYVNRESVYSRDLNLIKFMVARDIQ